MTFMLNHMVNLIKSKLVRPLIVRCKHFHSHVCRPIFCISMFVCFWLLHCYRNIEIDLFTRLFYILLLGVYDVYDAIPPNPDIWHCR